MTAEPMILDDLRSLSLQLNRQAFASPPVEGWLNSFLTMLCERFDGAGVQGVQVIQMIGNVSMQVASAGHVPAEATTQNIVDESSPLIPAIRDRQVTTLPGARIFPVTVGSDGIGAMVVYLDDEHTPLTALDHALETLAAQLGPALMQHLRTPGPRTGRLLRQIDMMRSVYQATRDFSSALDSPELLLRAARSLVETLQIDHVGIVVFDSKERVGTVICEYPDSGVVGTRIPMIGPVQERLQKLQQPIVIDSVETASDLGPERALWQQIGIKSIALLPMIVQGELIGSVGLDAFYEPRHFTPEELEAAAAVTGQLAVSAHNAQLYEELRRRAYQLERITVLSRRVTSTFDRTQIFQIAREETQQIVDADLIVVALRNPQSATLSLYLLVEGAPVVAEFPTERAALRFVFNTAEPLALDDISGSEDPDYRLLAASYMRAAAIVPLIAGGRTIGAYGVLHREPGHYVSIDLAVLEQIGSQLAIALENARLYAETSQRAETERLMNRLSGNLQSRGDLQGTLLSTVQDIAEALGARRARVRMEMPQTTVDQMRLEAATRSGGKGTE
jgi:GAF domain-containing protein